MPKRRKLSELDLPPPDELALAILQDSEWFSIFDLVALLTGQAGVRWRQQLQGELTYDDWIDFTEANNAAFESLAGSIHTPDGRWEFPIAMTSEEIILPDSVTEEQEAEVSAHLRGLRAAA